jgi:hypothetical protein
VKYAIITIVLLVLFCEFRGTRKRNAVWQDSLTYAVAMVAFVYWIVNRSV